MAGIKKILAIFVAFVVITVLLGYSSKVMFPIKYRDIVIKCSNENNLDPALVFAVIKIESNFKAKAVSSKNARGLMQISEKTAEWGSKELGLIDFSMDDLFEPEINIRIGCWYLGVLMKEFGNDTDLVIAAYNGGSGNVRQWLGDRSISTSGEKLDRIPFPETEQFLKKVNNTLLIYKKLYENRF